MNTSGIKVFAPATVANVACGFDVLGFAIQHIGDEVVARRTDTGKVVVANITGDKGKLSRDADKNTASIAAQAVLDYLEVGGVGIELEIRKKLPIGSGLGSSAASAVAGALAANVLLGSPLTKQELLPFAALGEAFASGSIHLDNVAPSMLGGFVLTRDSETYDVHRLIYPQGLYATVVHPQVEVLTKEARAILSPTLRLQQHIVQSANLGALVVGLYKGDFDLIGRCLTDIIIEPQRAALIPNFYEIKDAAMDAGAMGCSISGAGPSIFAVSKSSIEAEKIGAAMQSVYQKAKVPCTVWCSVINNEGAEVL